jgi:hypothetical protein
MHAMMCAFDFICQCRLTRRQWLGVGHFEHSSDPAEHCGMRACLQVFLVLKARLAEMYLAVDHTGQDVQTLAINDFTCLFWRERSERNDAATGNSDIAFARPIMIDHGPAFEDQVEIHGRLLLAARVSRA